MKRLLLFFLVIMAAATAHGDTIPLSTIPKSSLLSGTKKVEVAEVEQASMQENVLNLKFTTFTNGYKTKVGKAYWFRTTIANDINRPASLFLNNTRCDYTVLYEIIGGKLNMVGKAGLLVPSDQLMFSFNRFHLEISLKENQTTTFYWLAYNKHRNAPIVDSIIINEEDTLLNIYREGMTYAEISLFFLGAFGFLALFMLFMYYKSRHVIYLCYSLYLFGAILYTFTRLSTIISIGAWSNNFPVWRIAFSEPAQFLFFAVYNLFVIELLDAKKQNPLFAKIVKNLAIGYVVYAIIYYIFNYFYLDVDLRNLLFQIHRAFLFPVNIALIIWCLYKIRTPVLVYFIAGISAFMLSSIVAVVLSVNYHTLNNLNFPLGAVSVYQIGLMIEALFFAFALGYKIKLTEDEKNKHQQQLLVQLEANRVLAEKVNRELEEKVKQRTAELVTANKRIEEKKAKELESYFEKKLAQAETMALRSQMNPHFLFNSLNSIKYLIQSAENKLAITYLIKFSKLVRLVLEHSKSELITLSSEVAALQLYLEIESNRLGEQFSYQISTPPNINLDEIQIPPMFLQPFVENAIWHGLLNSERSTKEVTIIFSKLPKRKGIKCEITDNGIGRQKAESLKKYTIKPHTSFGTSLIFDRVKLFNQQYSNQIEVEIQDRMLNNEPQGTTVIVYIYEANTNHIS